MITTLLNSSMSFGERVGQALTNLVLGMAVVFSVLTILYIVILLVGKIFVACEKKKSAASTKNENESQAVSTIKEAEQTDNDGAIVAAITAAIAEVMSSEGTSPVGFRVVSFKKTNAKSSWNNK